MTNINNKIITRFYYPSTIQNNGIITLSKDDSHHLTNVLKAHSGEFISIFNESNGEFICSIESINKSSTLIKVISCIKNVEKEKYNLHLAFAPLKKDANDFIIEKATELGITTIGNIITQRTVNKPIDNNKMLIKLKQASQQCKRLSVPNVVETKKLSDFIGIYKENSTLLWLNEFNKGEILHIYLQKNISQLKYNVILIIGPEGGFTKEEMDFLSIHTHPVYIKGNILRAETASITSIINFNIICNI